MTIRIAILTISDSRARGELTDDSGETIAAWAKRHQWPVAVRAVVPDEADQISKLLAEWCDKDTADLVLTTGGTGLAPRDVTPEATRAILEKEAPGIGELFRMAVYPRLHRAVLSRGVAGVRRRTLIVNLPGSPGGVRNGLEVFEDLVEHAVGLVRGTEVGH